MFLRVSASGAPPSSTTPTSSRSSSGWWAASRRVSSRPRGLPGEQTWRWGRTRSSSYSKGSWESLNALRRAERTSVTGAPDLGFLHHPIRSSPLMSIHADRFVLMTDLSVWMCVRDMCMVVQKFFCMLYVSMWVFQWSWANCESTIKSTCKHTTYKHIHTRFTWYHELGVSGCSTSSFDVNVYGPGPRQMFSILW